MAVDWHLTTADGRETLCRMDLSTELAGTSGIAWHHFRWDRLAQDAEEDDPGAALDLDVCAACLAEYELHFVGRAV